MVTEEMIAAQLYADGKRCARFIKVGVNGVALEYYMPLAPVGAFYRLWYCERMRALAIRRWGAKGESWAREWAEQYGV